MQFKAKVTTNIARCRFAQLRADPRGNVMVIFAMALLPLTFVIGFGIDYTKAMQLDSRLKAAADAAALAAVSYIELKKSDADAAAVAKGMFNQQVAMLNGLVYNPNNLKINISSATGVAGDSARTVTVTYSAESTNIFSSILGRPTLVLGGISQADTGRLPDLDISIVLDTSPSMLLPTTMPGIARMRMMNISQASVGCAFACHTRNPHASQLHYTDPNDSEVRDIFLENLPGGERMYRVVGTRIDQATGKLRILYKDPGGVQTLGPLEESGRYADSLWAAKNYGMIDGGPQVELRVDAEQTAVQNLIPFARNISEKFNVTYRMRLFEFGSLGFKSLTPAMENVKTMSTSSVPNLLSLQWMWHRNGWLTETNFVDDKVSDFTEMFDKINPEIAQPGNGLNQAPPQQVMFLITDGMIDQKDRFFIGGRALGALNAAHIAQCQAIKNRGIRIAILYTKYEDETIRGDSWAQNTIAPALPAIPLRLAECASKKTSGEPLFYEVNSQQSIPDGLSALFALVIKSARLTR